jgi:hypothetical protein
MATADALDTHPTAFENTIFEHRFYHVLAAGGCIAARRRRQRGDEEPVEIDRQKKNIAQHYFYSMYHWFISHVSFI